MKQLNLFLLLAIPFTTTACEDDLPFCSRVKVLKVIHHPKIPNNRDKCVLKVTRIPENKPWYYWAAGENCQGIELNKELDVLLTDNCYEHKPKPKWKTIPNFESHETKDFEDYWDLIFIKDSSYPMHQKELEPTIAKACKKILKDESLQ